MPLPSAHTHPMKITVELAPAAVVTLVQALLQALAWSQPHASADGTTLVEATEEEQEPAPLAIERTSDPPVVMVTTSERPREPLEGPPPLPAALAADFYLEHCMHREIAVFTWLVAIEGQRTRAPAALPRS